MSNLLPILPSGTQIVTTLPSRMLPREGVIPVRVPGKSCDRLMAIRPDVMGCVSNESGSSPSMRVSGYDKVELPRAGYALLIVDTTAAKADEFGDFKLPSMHG